MKRKFEEKKEVTQTITRTVCDICGEVVMDKPYTQLYATDGRNGVSWEDTLEVCTPACLVKNITGIKCVLDAKMIPSADTSMKKDASNEKCEEAPSLSYGSKVPKIFIPISIGK